MKPLVDRLGAGTASAALLAVLSAGSKGLGFVREVLLAWAFGTSAVVDAVRLGMTYTTYFSHLFFGEAMSGTLVPMLARLRESEQDDGRRRQLVAGVTLAAIGITIPVGIVFVAAPATVVDVLAPSLGADSRAQTIAFLRVFGLAIPFYALTAVVVMIRQAASDFAPLGLRAVGQNLFFIGGVIVAFVGNQPLVIPLSFLLYYAFLLIVLDRGSLLVSLRAGSRRAVAGLRTLLVRWLPLMSGLMLWRSNALVERYFGSQLPEGAIASVDYGRAITDLPLLLLAVPAGAVLLTTVSRSPANRLSPSQRRKLGYLTLLVVAWSAVVFVLAEPLTTMIFRRGSFDADSVRVTSEAVRGLSVGAWALALGHVLTQLLLATARSRSVVLPAGISVVTNVAVAIELVPTLGVLGLTLASSSAAITYGTSAMIVFWLQRRTLRDPHR